jgi:flavin-binding protein dodecin
MADHRFRLVELVCSSTSSPDDAIRQPIETAAKTHRHIQWFEVTETRGQVGEGRGAHFQVSSRAGFRLEH